VLDPREAIDRLTAAYRGPHPGHRTLHARGTFYTGTYTASPEAGALARAAVFSGQPVPVLVRWSNAAGSPRLPDKASDVRGMAVKFRSDAGDTDLLGQTAPRFPVREPADFVSMTEAAARPATFPLWVARHPGTIPALVANARAKAIAPPFSYAEKTYYPIHAYRWVAPDGTRRWVRYEMRPLAGSRPEGTFEGFDRLRQEIVARLAEGTVRYDLHVVVAADGDDPHDPTSVWKGARELSAGVIEVTTPVDDPEASGGPVVFDPTWVVDGIELSDDPILRYRPSAYSESVGRRTSSQRDGV
jgi:catalase